MLFPSARIAKSCAVALISAGCAVPVAHGQSLQSDGAMPTAQAQLMATYGANGNKAFYRSASVSYLQNLIDSSGVEVTDPSDAWTSADVEAAVDLFLAPVIDELDRRVILFFESQIATADAERLNLALKTEASVKAMNCGLSTAAAERTSAIWSGCERSNGVTFSAQDREALGNMQIAYSTALAQPVLNAALGGTICHALARYAQHLSKDGTSYKFGVTFAMAGGEEPKRCDVHKARWAALAGFDAVLRMEPQMVFEKKED